jgi:hypothetical protein
MAILLFGTLSLFGIIFCYACIFYLQIVWFSEASYDDDCNMDLLLDDDGEEEGAERKRNNAGTAGSKLEFQKEKGALEEVDTDALQHRCSESIGDEDSLAAFSFEDERNKSCCAAEAAFTTTTTTTAAAAAASGHNLNRKNRKKKEQNQAMVAAAANDLAGDSSRGSNYHASAPIPIPLAPSSKSSKIGGYTPTSVRPHRSRCSSSAEDSFLSHADASISIRDSMNGDGATNNTIEYEDDRTLLTYEDDEDDEDGSIILKNNIFLSPYWLNEVISGVVIDKDIDM